MPPKSAYPEVEMFINNIKQDILSPKNFVTPRDNLTKDERLALRNLQSSSNRIRIQVLMRVSKWFNMAGRVTTMSVNFGILLCLFLILNGIKQDKTLMKPLSNSSNLYFTSQEACRVDIQSFHSLAQRPVKHQAVGAFQKGFITCKLLRHASLALALIALARDVELNPGYRS